MTGNDCNVPVELTAVVVAVTEAEPRVLTVQRGSALPSGPLSSRHRTLQQGLRAWVDSQTHHALGYLEQLYTFADRDRLGANRAPSISISYLGLTREENPTGESNHAPCWRAWYHYLPWEDWREGCPRIMQHIVPRLHAWVGQASNIRSRKERDQRVSSTFPVDDRAWNEELVLQRYELLYEAGLVREADRRSRELAYGTHMFHDHRRILATAIARLRAKIKYRPVVFELMPASFTLLQLQRTMEALAGRKLHKQNFRRLIEHHELVEETGTVDIGTGGRPAKLFRFRGEIVAARALVGTRLPLAHSS